MDVSDINAVMPTINRVFTFITWSLKKIKFVFTKRKDIVFHFENSQFPEFSNWWHMGAKDSHSFMQVAANLLVTNNTDKQVILTGCLLKKHKIRGQILTKAAAGRIYSGENPISPGGITKVSLDFLVQPPLIKEEDFVSDIVIIDNYGNNHLMRRVKFKYI